MKDSNNNLESLKNIIGSRLYYDNDIIIIENVQKINDEIYFLYSDHGRFLHDSNFRGCMSYYEYTNVINNQRELKEEFNKNKTYQEKQDIIEKLTIENENQQNDLYGFLDNNVMRQGKARKILLRLINYNNKTMTRKGFIIDRIKSGSLPEIHKSFGYIVRNKDRSSIDITKTEYDFMKYLIENHIIEALQL